ncbi:hypothetical protein [Prolixibacter sp. SD074]|uniref:hypothetical protein n=1 Tax=Prolixibacter sp. SD074 TaxID=2652391 RepID=UPI00127C605D|nr:hypothetical protein [Prolixibacter sp. SD074]GET30470.1 hypothetical protein SD074_26720 [Prolixibacter sp. SD074]
MFSIAIEKYLQQEKQPRFELKAVFFDMDGVFGSGCDLLFNDGKKLAKNRKKLLYDIQTFSQ